MTVNKMEQEATVENTGDDFEMVSINSVYFNKTYSVLMANLKTLVSENSISILYKIDPGGDANIMLWHILKNYFLG